MHPDTPSTACRENSVAGALAEAVSRSGPLWLRMHCKAQGRGDQGERVQGLGQWETVWSGNDIPQDAGRTDRGTGGDGERLPAFLWQEAIQSSKYLLLLFIFCGGD